MAPLPGHSVDVAIIRGTTADELGNISTEHKGAYLGALDQAMAARNNDGVVIAQVERLTTAGSVAPQQVRIPGYPGRPGRRRSDQWQTTQTEYDPAISGELRRTVAQFDLPDWGLEKVIARRAALELIDGEVVNLGFGISALVPGVLLEEGLDGRVTRVIEQGACRRHAVARVSVRLCSQRGGNHALASPVHLFPGGRIRPVPAVIPAGGCRRQCQRFEAAG